MRLALAALLVPSALAACSPRDDAGGEGRLEARVAELEARLERLEAQLKDLRADDDAARIADVAGARTCALDVARTMEAFKGDNGRYPGAENLTLPGSCADFRVDWTSLRANAYAFRVLSADGRLLTRQDSD